MPKMVNKKNVVYIHATVLLILAAEAVLHELLK